MRKTVAYLLVLVMLLTGCREEKRETDPVDHSGTIASLKETWVAETEEYRELQKDLARWYNINLASQNPERGYESAYERILYYDNGVMGYVEIPSLGLTAPIFHGEEKGGFSHDSHSAFPIGGRGNHTVLNWDKEIILEDGERVILWILGEPLVYVVGQNGEDQCTLICKDRAWDCGRMVED